MNRPEDDVYLDVPTLLASLVPTSLRDEVSALRAIHSAMVRSDVTLLGRQDGEGERKPIPVSERIGLELVALAGCEWIAAPVGRIFLDAAGQACIPYSDAVGLTWVDSERDKLPGAAPALLRNCWTHLLFDRKQVKLALVGERKNAGGRPPWPSGLTAPLIEDGIPASGALK
jgi:hypothetical protein